MNTRVWPRNSSGHFLPRCSAHLGLLFEDYLHVQQQIPNPILKARLSLSLSSSRHQEKKQAQGLYQNKLRAAKL